MTDEFENRAASFAAYVISLADVLEPHRRKLFLEWLGTHSGQVIQGSDRNCIRDSLTNWFASLSKVEVLREYYLVICEINWWRNLKEETLEDIKVSGSRSLACKRDKEEIRNAKKNS